MPFPLYRPRRLRESPLLRSMVRETTLRAADFVYPLFAVHGRGVREPIGSMPGQHRLSIDELLKECKDAASMGIPAVLLFGLPRDKDPRGTEAYAEDGIIQQAVRAVKDTIPDLLVITDVCLCEYTSHGHCGVVEGGSVRNALEAMREVALDVDEGADIVMVKPALPYLDIIARVKGEFGLPVAAYSVSGEYAMLKAAGQLGWLDEERAMIEALTGIRRAGADIIITYFAKDAARLIEQGRA